MLMKMLTIMKDPQTHIVVYQQNCNLESTVNLTCFLLYSEYYHSALNVVFRLLNLLT